MPNQPQRIIDESEVWRVHFPGLLAGALGAFASVVPSPLTEFELVFHFSILAKFIGQRGPVPWLNGARRYARYASDRLGQRTTKGVSRSFFSAVVRGSAEAIARSSNPVLSSAEQGTFLYLVKKGDNPLGFSCEPLRGDIVIVPSLLSSCKPRYT